MPDVIVMKPCPACGGGASMEPYVPPRIDFYIARIRRQYEQNPHVGYVFECACGHRFEAWDFGTPYAEDRAIRTWNHHASSQVSRVAMRRVGLSAWRRPQRPQQQPVESSSATPHAVHWIAKSRALWRLLFVGGCHTKPDHKP